MTGKIKWSKPQRQTLDCLSPKNKKVTDVFFGGSAGPGKSFLGCSWQIMRRLAYPGTRGLIGRSELKNLKATTLMTFFEVWERTFYRNPMAVTIKYNEQKSIIEFSNGSFIYLMDLFLYPRDRNFTRLGGLELTDAFVDEMPEVTRKAVDILRSRIRYKLIGGIPKILGAGNPEHNWVKFDYVMNKHNEPVNLPEHRAFISSKVDDNPDKEFVRTYRRQLETLPLLDRQRLLHGDWAVIENEQPFFYEFSQDKNVTGRIPAIDQFEPVWISFDFNINPTTAIIAQKIPGRGIYIHKEYQVKGGTSRLCDELQPWVNYILNITGDHSGHSGSTAAGLVEGGEYNTDYQIIKEKLLVSSRQLIDTRTANKRHTYSRQLCNHALFRLPIFISRNGCPGLISDLQTAQPTKQGRLLKDRDNHKQDLGDAFRYLVNSMFQGGAKEINEFADLIGVRAA